MIVWLRNGVVIFVILTLAYALLSFKARRKEQDRLNAAYADSDKTVSKADYIADGLDTYNRSFRPKLLLGVYGVPLLILSGLIYLAYA